MKKIWSTLLIATVGGLVAVGSFVWLGGDLAVHQNEKPKSQMVEYHPFQTIPVSGASVPPGSMDFTRAAEMSVHAVVHVTTESVPQTYYNPWSDFFGGRRYYQAEPARSAGSGVIISPDGYIVTNNHVIAEAHKIEVTMNDMRTYEAVVVGSDPSTDLALLKIDDSELPYLTFGNSDDIKVGEWVLAVGNPFNLTSTVTAGIVSAKARNLNLLRYDPGSDQFPIESFIQTDAAVNPGNSGGALVSITGDLIGINTAIASKTGSYSGYAFAIPASIVQKVTNDLFEFGRVQRAFVGVSIANISEDLARSEKLQSRSGAYVRGLTDGGAAAEAGIKIGDIINKVNDANVRNVTELQEQIARFRPGDSVVVGVTRGKEQKFFNLTLRNQHGNTEMRSRAADVVTAAFGATFEEADDNTLRRLNIKQGVVVDNITDGSIQKAGIKNGFIITRIDKKPVSTPEDVSKILKESRGGVLIEGMYPNGSLAYYGFGL